MIGTNKEIWNKGWSYRALISYFVCAALLLLAPCVEYSIAENKAAIGIPNPPQIENQRKIDVITQIVKAEVDVLWIIDNSCSMQEEQAALVNNFNYFISYFVDSKLDWHIGVTSTDMSPGDVPGNHGTLNMVGSTKFIDENTPNPIQTFTQLASMGTSGSGIEQGLASTYGAIEVHNGCDHNRDFYRKDATLSVIIISDEEDYSESPTLNEFISWLKSLKEDVDDITFSSIVCLSEVSLNGIPCNSGWNYPDVGTKYISVTNAIGGILWDIREDDWQPVLDQLGLQAAGLKSEFFLSDIPVERTLDVFVEIPNDPGPGETIYNFILNEDYIYSQTRNSITFNTYIPPESSGVHIDYIPLGSYYGNIYLDSGALIDSPY